MKNATPSLGERAADALVSAALAADVKHGPEGPLPCPSAAALFRAVHAAIAVAALNGVSRRVIERRCNLGHRVLDDMMSSKPRTIGIDTLARMLLEPDVLGAEAHALLRGQLLIQMRVVAIDSIEPARNDQVTLEVLDVADSCGALAERAREAQHEDSPGGVEITPMERIEIGAHAGVVMDESAQLAAPGRDARDA